MIVLAASLTAIKPSYASDPQVVTSTVGLLDQETPLTDDFIKATWPDLPSAKELRESSICFCVDSRDYSDKAAFYSIVQNCTRNGINAYSGGWILNEPHIWLQYDENVWIAIPSTYFK